MVKEIHIIAVQKPEGLVAEYSEEPLNEQAYAQSTELKNRKGDVVFFYGDGTNLTANEIEEFVNRQLKHPNDYRVEP